MIKWYSPIIFYLIIGILFPHINSGQRNKFNYEPDYFKIKTMQILSKISPIVKDEFETNIQFEKRLEEQNKKIERLNSQFKTETIENIKITTNRPGGKMRKYDAERQFFRVAAYISGEWMVSKWRLNHSNLIINKKLGDLSNWGGVFYKGQYEMFFVFIIPPNQAKKINTDLSNYRISFDYLPQIEVTRASDGPYKVVYTIQSYRLVDNKGKIIAEHS